jgi:hypothetical protein
VRHERPGLQVVVVPEGGVVTMDHNLGRVRVYARPDGTVARMPKLGSGRYIPPPESCSRCPYTHTRAAVS